MSDPISPDQASRSSSAAGRPASWLAAHRAVAALPEPPPSPAPCGTRLRSPTRYRSRLPVLRRNRSSACVCSGLAGGYAMSVLRAVLCWEHVM